MTGHSASLRLRRGSLLQTWNLRRCPEFAVFLSHGIRDAPHVSAKDKMIRLIERQPEDSSYDDLLREL